MYIKMPRPGVNMMSICNNLIVCNFAVNYYDTLSLLYDMLSLLSKPCFIVIVHCTTISYSPSS